MFKVISSSIYISVSVENLLFLHKSKQNQKYFHLKSVIFLNKNHISNDFDIP